MLHIRGTRSLSFICPEDFHSPASSDMQVAPIYQATFPIAHPTRVVSGLFWLSATSPQAWLELSVLCRSLNRTLLLSGWPYMAGTCVSPPVCHCRNEQTCLDLPITCGPSAHFNLHQSPVCVVAASLEECGRSQHSCMKTELTLCCISSLLTWNSTVSFLADK